MKVRENCFIDDWLSNQMPKLLQGKEVSTILLNVHDRFAIPTPCDNLQRVRAAFDNIIHRIVRSFHQMSPSQQSSFRAAKDHQ